jgi:hypothetical protein
MKIFWLVVVALRFSVPLVLGFCSYILLSVGLGENGATAFLYGALGTYAGIEAIRDLFKIIRSLRG